MRSNHTASVLRRALPGAVLAGITLGHPAALPAGPPAPFGPDYQVAEPVPPAPPRPRARDGTRVIRARQQSYLGVGVADLSPEKARQLKLEDGEGVEVTTVTPDSPAHRAGLREGDVIVQFNGEPVQSKEQLGESIRELRPGRKVTVTVSRNGNEETLTAILGIRKDEWVITQPGADFAFEFETKFKEKFKEQFRELEKLRFIPDIPKAVMLWRNPLLGIEAEALSSQLAEYFGVKEGVLVRSVAEGTAGDRAGLKAGDVILSVDGRRITSPGELTSALRSDPAKKSYNLTIRRNHKELNLAVGLDDRAALDVLWGIATAGWFEGCTL